MQVFRSQVRTLTALPRCMRPKALVPRDLARRQRDPGLVVAHASLSEGYIKGTPLQSGGIGMIGTTRDYLRFAQMLLNGGQLDGVRILSPATINYMTRNHLGDVPMGLGRAGAGFGLGFAVVTDPARVGDIATEGEYSWGGAAGTTFWVDPKEKLVGVFMVQSLPHRTTLKDEFRRLTYQAMTESYQ